MLIGGLWHGAAGRSSSGAGSTARRWRSSAGGGRGPAARAVRPAGRAGGARILTFHFVCFAWIFFRADSFAAAWDMIQGLFTRWGEASPLVTGGVLLAIAVGIGSQYLPARLPRARHGPLLAAARSRAGDRARTRAHADERPGPGGRGTLHLLPVLMADRRSPAAAAPRRRDPHAGAGGAPGTPPRGGARRRARPPEDEGPRRKLWSAGTRSSSVCSRLRSGSS